MDTFVVNKLTKSKPCKGTQTKISQSRIIKTHNDYQKKIMTQETKPECIFCNYKKPKKGSKKTKD